MNTTPTGSGYSGSFSYNFISPIQYSLEENCTLELPNIHGLRKQSKFILQGNQDNTFSTNIITKYESKKESLRLVEVYKNTEDRTQGLFIHLVGTISLVKKGYPFLFLDAAVSNISPLTAQKESVSTRVAIHLPQAEAHTRNTFFALLSETAKSSGIDFTIRELKNLPQFWGPLWTAHAPCLSLQTIEALRGAAWSSYRSCCEQVEENPAFDYRPTQQQMVFAHAASEHRFFRKMGLAVAPEAQAAFFSILSFTE